MWPGLLKSLEIERIKLFLLGTGNTAKAGLQVRERRFPGFHPRDCCTVPSGKHSLLKNAIAGSADAILHHYIRGQLAAFTTKPVGRPRPDAGKPRATMAGVHQLLPH